MDGIPDVLTSNFDLPSNIEPENEPWIILEYIDGVSLREFVKTRPITFQDKLIITLKLLHVIEQMHSRNVVHRYIKPDNIIITTQCHPANSNEIDLFLIDFSGASLTENDERNQNTIFANGPNHILNNFHQACQLVRQPSIQDNDQDQRDEQIIHSPTIDTTSICAILFWLITKEYPRASFNIDDKAPHQRGKLPKIINEELTRATGKCKGVTTDLDHSELKNKSCISFELIGVMMSHCESL